ncbi:MAG TPA: GMC oxidoreductase [Bryobacteraceae bacterium]|nr:GMC oxidoreductase [Bryobacteraceae bacterium]
MEHIFGADYKRDVRHWYGVGVGVSASGEGLRSPSNFVDIDPDVKDIWGIPAARIQMTFGDNEKTMVKDMTKRGIELIEAAGGTVTGWQVTPSIPGGQIHEQGTCRMGNDPEKFVTNRWGQCHDVPNLVLADGSLHVTCATENPTLTILTISMRNADHLADLVKRREL